MAELEHDGIRIHYDIHDETGGSGPPLLLIMGLGAASEWWFPQYEVLRERFRVICFDNRGTGQSDKPEGPYSMAQLAGDAVAVLRAAGHERAHVMGISMGGMIAQHVALDHPACVDRLALVATMAGGSTATQAAPEVLQALTQAGGIAPDEPEAALDGYGWIIFPRDYIEARRAELVAAMRRARAVPTPPHAFIAQVMAIAGHDTVARLGEIACETLVLTGDVDLLVPPENSRVLADGIPGAKLDVMAGAGHGLNVQQADAYNQRVSDFFAR